MTRKITVAVDGTAGSGKSFIFDRVAKKIGYELVDTGLMYRAFTYHLFAKRINFNQVSEIIAGLDDFNFDVQKGLVTVNEVDITDKLATNAVLENINKVTIIPEVRQYMMVIQRQIGSRPGVIELGRDITSVVLPNADLKIYLDAPLEIRAQRRYEQNQEQGIHDDYEAVFEKMQLRDETDKTRKIGALVIVPDA
jgi:cytidylate kinase